MWSLRNGQGRFTVYYSNQVAGRDFIINMKAEKTTEGSKAVAKWLSGEEL